MMKQLLVLCILSSGLSADNQTALEAQNADNRDVWWVMPSPGNVHHMGLMGLSNPRALLLLGGMGDTTFITDGTYDSAGLFIRPASIGNTGGTRDLSNVFISGSTSLNPSGASSWGASLRVGASQKGGTGTFANMASLYVEDAPTGGNVNWAAYVNGRSKFNLSNNGAPIVEFKQTGSGLSRPGFILFEQGDIPAAYKGSTVTHYANDGAGGRAQQGAYSFSWTAANPDNAQYELWLRSGADTATVEHALPQGSSGLAYFLFGPSTVTPSDRIHTYEGNIRMQQASQDQSIRFFQGPSEDWHVTHSVVQRTLTIDSVAARPLVLNPSGGRTIIGGGMQLASASRPVCDSTTRGTTWFVAGASGVKDNLSLCAKDAFDAYFWRMIY